MREDESKAGLARPSDPLPLAFCGLQESWVVNTVAAVAGEFGVEHHIGRGAGMNERWRVTFGAGQRRVLVHFGRAAFESEIRDELREAARALAKGAAMSDR